MRYLVKATSLNGKVAYDAEIEANSPYEAREIFKAQVRQGVRADYGITPRGLPYLADARTLEIGEAKDGEVPIVP